MPILRSNNRDGLERAPSVRVPELAVGIFIVAASVIGALVWQRSVEKGTPVLVTSHSIPRGHVLSSADLSTVVVTSTADIAIIRSSSTAQVVGMTSTVDLMAGTPLTPAVLSSLAVLGPLEGLVGLTVTLARAPGELSRGDFVRVYSVDSTGDGGSDVREIPSLVQIWDVSTPDPLSNERSVTVRVPLEAIGSLVGRDEIHLVKVVG